MSSHMSVASQLIQDIKDRMRLASEKAGYAAESVGYGIAVVTDDMIQQAQKELGQMYMDKRQWKKAVMHFVQCKQTDKVAECLFHLGDFDKLADIQNHFTESSEVHKALARNYQSAGMCSEACTSFVKVMHRQLVTVIKPYGSMVQRLWGRLWTQRIFFFCRLV